MARYKLDDPGLTKLAVEWIASALGEGIARAVVYEGIRDLITEGYKAGFLAGMAYQDDGA